MRRILISALILILIAIFTLMAASGINIGKLKIASIREIIEENEQLDTDIENLNTTIETDYVSAKSNLDASFKKLQTSKQKYQDTIIYSTEEEIKAANQTEKYEIGYLWTKIGLFATKNNVIIQANVTSGSVSGLYNISFTATGEYISISEFIRAIENDSNLGFKIEDFAMSPNTSNENLKATFVIRNISIDSDSLTKSASGTTSLRTTTTDAGAQE